MLKIATTPQGEALEGKKTRERRLNDIGSVRLEMVSIYQAMKSRRIDSTDGKSLVWVLQTIRDTLKVADLEKRLEELEKRLQDGGNG